MIKLLIHIGYPKTGTTSLQENLFFPLHQEGHINYLGRVYFKIDEFSGVDKAIILRKELLFDKNQETIELDPDKLNVISDENLTMASKYNECQYGVQSDGLSYPPRLTQALKEADKVTVLLSLRVQTTLLYSLYCQKFKFIFNEDRSITFGKHISDAEGNFDGGRFKVYDFLVLVREYKKALDRVDFRFLLFEDLKSDIDNYSEQLSEILDIEAIEIRKKISSKHYRKKSAGKEKGKLEIMKLRFPFLTLNNTFDLAISSYKYYPNSVLHRLFNKIVYKKGFKIMESVQKREEEKIEDYYCASNYDFFIANGISLEKGKKYGYFKTAL